MTSLCPTRSRSRLGAITVTRSSTLSGPSSLSIHRKAARTTSTSEAGYRSRARTIRTGWSATPLSARVHTDDSIASDALLPSNVERAPVDSKPAIDSNLAVMQPVRVLQHCKAARNIGIKDEEVDAIPSNAARGCSLPQAPRWGSHRSIRRVSRFGRSSCIIIEATGVAEHLDRPSIRRIDKTPQPNQAPVAAKPSKTHSALPQCFFHCPVVVSDIGLPGRTLVRDPGIRRSFQYALNILRGRQNPTASAPGRDNHNRIVFEHLIPHLR